MTIELEKIIKEEVKILGEIEEINIFSTWFNQNCAIVINKVVYYGLRLIIHSPHLKTVTNIWGPTEEKLTSIRIIKISEHIFLEEAKKQAKKIEEKLNGDYPILALCKFFTDYSSITSQIRIKSKFQVNSEFILNEVKVNYLNKYDVISRPINGLAKHFGVYLGEGRVAHLGKEGTYIANLEDFLDGKEKLTSYHYIIPFKNHTIIQRHIDKAVNVNYGKDKYSLLLRNCEHFANLCVCGVNISEQPYSLLKTERLGLTVEMRSITLIIDAIKEVAKYKNLKRQIKISDCLFDKLENFSEAEIVNSQEELQQVIEISEIE